MARTIGTSASPAYGIRAMGRGGVWLAAIGTFCLIGAAVLAWAVGAPPTANGTTAAVVRIGSGEEPRYVVAPGGQVAVPVAIVDAANLGTATLLLAYDPSQVQVVGCSALHPTGVDIAVCNANYAPGLLRFSLVAASGLNGSHALFTVTLQATAPAGTTAELLLTAPQFVDIQGDDLPLTLISGALSISGAAQPVDALLRIDPERTDIVPGEYVIVAVTVAVTEAHPLAAATIQLQYDPQVVRPVQCTRPAASPLLGSCNPSFNLVQGLIRFNVLADGGASGLLHLYDIAFEVVGTAALGATTLLAPSVQNMVDTGDQAMSWLAENGAITVIAGPSNAAQVMVGAPEMEGRFAITQGVTISVPVWVADVANLGAATIALHFDPALLQPLGCMVHSAGIDGGNCTIHAGRVQANIIASRGVSGSLPIFEALFTPLPEAGAGFSTALLLDVLNFADANAQPLPLRTRNGQLDLFAGDPSNLPLISLGNGAGAVLAQDGRVTVTVGISGVAALGAATIIVRYDPAVVTVVSCTPAGAFDGNSCILGNGEIRLSLLSGAGFTGATPVVELVFRAADNANVGDQTVLGLSVTNFSDIMGEPILYQVATSTIVITAALGTPAQAILRTNRPFYDVRPDAEFRVAVQAILDSAALPQGLDSAAIRLRYDPAVVRPIACAFNADAFLGGGCNLGFAQDQLRFSLIGGAGVSGDVTLVNVIFKVVGQPGASAGLTLHVDQLAAAAALEPTYRTERATVQITIDGDGVSDAVEAGGPNNGDGNGDGIPDAEQLHVTSLPNPLNGLYLTLVGPPSSCLNDLEFVPNPSPADTPAGWSFPLGFLSFRLGCLPPGSAATVTVLLHDNVTLQLDQFFIFVPGEASAGGGWSPFLLVGNIGAEFAAGSIVLQLADGQRGDGDGASNGEIAFLGAPGRRGAAIGVVPLTLRLVEGGSPATYQVSLLARPAAPVTVTITTNGQTAVNPTQLLFALDDWSIVQTVTVSAVVDQVIEGVHTDEVRHAVVSTDAAFDGLVMVQVAVTIEDSAGSWTPTPTITPGGPTLTPTPTPTITPGGPTLTPTPTPTITPGGPTLTPTPTPTITPGGPTLTPTPTITPGGPTLTPTPTPTRFGASGPSAAYLPMVARNPHIEQPATVYLPVIVQPGLPDLVVDQIFQDATGLQIVIRNSGRTPVVDDFWVDAYIAPNMAPTAVNQTWDTVGAQGLVWGVTSMALPIHPGQRITLTVGDAYYWPDYSLAAWPLAPGTPIYVQVDSYGDATDYGAVLEVHERANQPYNNIASAVIAGLPGAQGVAAALPAPAALDPFQQLPPRTLIDLLRPADLESGQP